MFCKVPPLAITLLHPLTNCTDIPQFCCSNLPCIYQYIQKEHWNLGMLAYYQFRKLPNFVLATPIVVIVMSGTAKYLKERWHEIKYLGLMSNSQNSTGTGKLMFTSKNIFCFVINAFALIVFSLLYMHVEVSTRFLYSSSPLPYWIIASYILQDVRSLDLKAIAFSDIQHFSTLSQFLIFYIVSYFIIGTALHVNFLPWT